MAFKSREPIIGIYRCLARVLIALIALLAAASALNPVPLINQPLVPDATKPGGAGFTLTVNGTGFVSGSVVHWNGNARATAFIGKSQLKATILASDIAKPGMASVTVINPSPGGGTSNVAFFEVTWPSSSIALGSLEEYTTGYGGAASVLTADVNGDGRLDLVVANRRDSTVSVILGNGDGTFQPPVGYGVGSGPYSVSVGDFNGDGRLDLVVANNGSNDVSVLLGNGDGTFQGAVNYPGRSGPQSVVVGDFNGDGKLDLAVANYTDNDISILLGNGDGSFQAPVNYPVVGSPTALSAGDFNRDGKLDLIVANNGSNDVSVLLGNGDGTFQGAVNYPGGSGPSSVAVGDFNGDGRLDVAVADYGNGAVSVLLGNGNGTLQPTVSYGGGNAQNATSVAVGDFNGDGKLDLIVTLLGPDVVCVLLGNGDGTFQPATYYVVAPFPTWVTVGDFNRDGRLETAVSHYQNGVVSILLQVPTVFLSETNLTFGSQVVGTSSVSQTVTLSNTSGLTLKTASIAVTGANATDFNQSHTCGSSLAPGASCRITVTFTPSQVGPRSASVTITDNAVDSPESIALSGTGVVSGPNVTLSATSLTYSTQVVGTTSTAQSVTLTNYGTVALTITGISFTGTDYGDFAQTNTCGGSVPSGASCNISVDFTPTIRGLRTATLAVTDDAPRSPQTVALIGTGTVVKLNPASLFFGCRIRLHNCPPAPRSSTLTNVGGTPLTISSITITGGSFSQTNNCPSVLGPSGSCTITVRWRPPGPTQLYGAVSIYDNGGGSPQHVGLDGWEKTAMSPAALKALGAAETASVPIPTGPSMVGTRIVQMVDPLRDDPFLGDGTKRQLMVRFWYPTSAREGCEPARYASQSVWSYFSQLTGFPLPEVTTNSCLDARVADGVHPVVVFTHGYTGTFTDYTYLVEDLASRGYVVAAVDHTYEATAVELPAGRLVKSAFGSHLAESTWRRDEQSLSLAVSVRLKDLKFVVDELTRLNGEPGGPFADKLDLSKVAIAGHSLGGRTAWLSAAQDPRFQVAILLDASLSDVSASVTQTPVLIFTMGREQWSDEECRMWSDLRRSRLAVNLKGAEHVTPSDAVWLAKGAVKTGPMGPDKTIEALRDYIAAFLDTNVRGRPLDPLLTGPSAEFPDAEVTTQKQALCGEAATH